MGARAGAMETFMRSVPRIKLPAVPPIPRHLRPAPRPGAAEDRLLRILVGMILLALAALALAGLVPHAR